MKQIVIIFSDIIPGLRLAMELHDRRLANTRTTQNSRVWSWGEATSTSLPTASTSPSPTSLTRTATSPLKMLLTRPTLPPLPPPKPKLPPKLTQAQQNIRWHQILMFERDVWSPYILTLPNKVATTYQRVKIMYFIYF